MQTFNDATALFRTRFLNAVCLVAKLVLMVTLGQVTLGTGTLVQFLEGDVLHQRLGVDILLHHLAVLLAGAGDDALSLRLEQYTARSDGRCRSSEFQI